MLGSGRNNEKLEELLSRMKALEKELIEEVQKKEEEFFYEIKEKKIEFEREMKKRHQQLKMRIPRFLLESKPLNVATAPIIYGVFPFMVMLDATSTLYQWICFPVYGIPTVKRSDYFLFDRRFLSYLNPVEKVNCLYCGYFNGLAAYLSEIGARTEQYWCPIKHAKKLTTIHKRYHKFIEYGDAETYRTRLEEIRSDFSDIAEEKKNG